MKDIFSPELLATLVVKARTEGRATILPEESGIDLTIRGSANPDNPQRPVKVVLERREGINSTRTFFITNADCRAADQGDVQGTLRQVMESVEQLTQEGLRVA